MRMRLLSKFILTAIFFVSAVLVGNLTKLPKGVQTAEAAQQGAGKSRSVNRKKVRNTNRQRARQGQRQPMRQANHKRARQGERKQMRQGQRQRRTDRRRDRAEAPLIRNSRGPSSRIRYSDRRYRDRGIYRDRRVYRSGVRRGDRRRGNNVKRYRYSSNGNVISRNDTNLRGSGPSSRERLYRRGDRGFDRNGHRANRRDRNPIRYSRNRDQRRNGGEIIEQEIINNNGNSYGNVGIIVGAGGGTSGVVRGQRECDERVNCGARLYSDGSGPRIITLGKPKASDYPDVNIISPN